MGHGMRRVVLTALGFTALVSLTSVTAAQARSRIVTPERDSSLTGHSVRVLLAAEGIEITPVSQKRAGTAHHHLFLDNGGVCALVGGETEFTFHHVRPGQHRLIALLADLNHRPITAAVADTVLFEVKKP
jgi:hypothetical protein